MPKYLDPKSDIVFKKIFGQHPKLLISFLNAVLPLPEDGLIQSLEYLPIEEVPEIPDFKFTVVDVKCIDQQGRIFIVEMQIRWTQYFMQRMLFGTSKAFVRQLQKGEDYNLLNPVYGLGILNTVFDKESEDWYHHYKIINIDKTNREIKGLQLVFIELPKFKPQNMNDKKLQVLWLKFLSEINEQSRKAPEELLATPEIKKALELAEEAAFSPGELEAYDRYWDSVSIEKTVVGENERKFAEIEKKLAEARMEAAEAKQAKEQARHAKQEEEKAKKSITLIARKMKDNGFTAEEIAEYTGLRIEDIRAL